MYLCENQDCDKEGVAIRRYILNALLPYEFLGADFVNRNLFGPLSFVIEPMTTTMTAE